MKLDRWDVLAIVGAGILGGGVWAEWGPARASMLWGCLLLALALVHEVRAARKESK